MRRGQLRPHTTLLVAGVLLAFLVSWAGLANASCQDSRAAAPSGAGTSLLQGPLAAAGAITSSPDGVTPVSSSLAYPQPEAQSPETVLEGMTLEQKAAQVLLLTFDGYALTPSTRELVQTAPPGGLLLMGSNIDDMNQLTALTGALQRVAATAGAPGLFIAVDQEGGIVRRVTSGVPALPSARDLATDSSPAVAGALALMTGAGLLAQGVNVVLAPVADVVSDPRSFLYQRTYGGAPGLVSSFVEKVTAGYESSGVIAVVKHFPGHGSAYGDSHHGTPVSDQSSLYYDLIHLPPFSAAFAAGAEGVMMGHFIAKVFDPDRPVSLSRPVIQRLLREQLGFSGLVVSDDLEMGGATGNHTGRGDRASVAELKAAAVAALQAGCDLLISTGRPDRQSALRDGIVEAVRNGTLPQERLDEAVLRILTLKAKYSIPLGG